MPIGDPPTYQMPRVDSASSVQKMEDPYVVKPIVPTFYASGEREMSIIREALDQEADRRMRVLAGYVLAEQPASRVTLYEAAKEFVTAHEMWDETGKSDG